jgi:hypothetical protein
MDFIRAEHAGDAGIVYCLSRKAGFAKRLLSKDLSSIYEL